MSTLAIPPKRVRLYRQLWDRWIIVLRILFDLGAASHPVNWRGVADTLLVDKKTAQKYLSALVRDGHLALAGTSYMLTSAGMEFLQELNEGGESFPLEGKNPGETFSPLKKLVVVNDSELKQLTPSPSKLGKNPGETFSPLAQLVFEHIPDLFAGAQLITTGLMPWANDEILLGWIAYAYDRRTSLQAPVGLIYRKLQRDERPPMDYVKNYSNYLPDPFLCAIGMQFSQEPVVEEPYEAPAPREMSEAERLLQVLAEQCQDISHVCVMWNPISFEGGVLRLGVRNDEHRDRWERRLGAKASQLLTEITQSDARVEFVVSVETEVE